MSLKVAVELIVIVVVGRGGSGVDRDCCSW